MRAEPSIPRSGRPAAAASEFCQPESTRKIEWCQVLRVRTVTLKVQSLGPSLDLSGRTGRLGPKSAFSNFPLASVTVTVAVVTVTICIIGPGTGPGVPQLERFPGEP